jgi:hypothetical protein
VGGENELASSLLRPLEEMGGWVSAEGKNRKEKDMEKFIQGLHKCVKCGIHKRNPDREFYGLWFVDFERQVGCCPKCAGQDAKRNSNNGSNIGLISRDLRAVWSTQR